MQDGSRPELRRWPRRALRPRLRRLWQVDKAAAVDIVNALLREEGALPQLVRHDEWDYHLHATPPGAPLSYVPAGAVRRRPRRRS